MPCISCRFIYLSLYLFITLSSIINVLPVHLFLRKPDPRLSVRLKALRSALRIVRKCFWSFLKIKRFDQAPIRYLWFVSRSLCGSIVSYPVRSFHHTRLKTMSNSGKVSSPVRIRPALTPYPNRNRFTDQSRKPAIQHLAQCLWNVLINMIIQVYVSFELLHENPSFGLVVSPSFCSGNTKMSVFSLIIPVIFPASTTFGKP